MLLLLSEKDAQSQTENEKHWRSLYKGRGPGIMNRYTNPRKAKKKWGEKLPEILYYDEMDNLIAACNDLEELAFLHVGFFGGLRISEITGLRVMDIRQDIFAVFVREETAKGDKPRWTPVTPTTISLLRGLSKGKGDEDLVFTRGNRAYQTRLDNLAEKAKLGRKINPHMMRHTCATMQLDRGIDIKTVSENLGHSNIETTEIYLHVDIRRRRRKYQDGLRGII